MVALVTVAPSGAAPLNAQDLDKVLAPVALYPDQLLSQMLMCAGNPDQVVKLKKWLDTNTSLKGTALQDAAVKAGFEPSFVALAIFPQVVNQMAGDKAWTTKLGQAFTADKQAVFASIQRLRQQAEDSGALKSTPQQEVKTQVTQSGQEVIVIEPANPQIVYVPQYNPQVVYTQPSTTVVVQQQSSSSSTDAAVAGLIGFTAGIALGAAIDNDYYYGPYGMRGGFYMYNDAWDDWYDHREDAREDWMDHREDAREDVLDHREELAEERGDRSRTAQEQRTERTEARQDTRAQTQGQRTERQQTRASSGTAATQSSTQRQTQPTTQRQTQSTTQRQTAQATTQRSKPSSDAFSGYSSGKSTSAASSRGQKSRSSSGAKRSGGGGRR
jgi:hypothetical protein